MHNSQSAVRPAYYVLHPQKVLPFAFFLTYQAFKNQEGIKNMNDLSTEKLRRFYFIMCGVVLF